MHVRLGFPGRRSHSEKLMYFIPKHPDMRPRMPCVNLKKDFKIVQYELMSDLSCPKLESS